MGLYGFEDIPAFIKLEKMRIFTYRTSARGIDAFFDRYPNLISVEILAGDSDEWIKLVRHSISGPVESSRTPAWEEEDSEPNEWRRYQDDNHLTQI